MSVLRLDFCFTEHNAISISIFLTEPQSGIADRTEQALS